MTQLNLECPRASYASTDESIISSDSEDLDYQRIKKED